MGRTVLFALPLIGGFGLPTAVVLGVVAGAVTLAYQVGKHAERRQHAHVPPPSY